MKKALASILALLMLVTMLPLTGIVTVSAAAANLATNGNFETGNADGWEIWQNTEISAAAKHSGSYGAHLKGDGGWGGMLSQAVTVKAGTAYKVNMWLKAVANGANIQIKDGGAEGTVLAGDWTNNTSWVEKTFLVTPTTNVLYINFCGGGTGKAESVYVDDVTVTESLVEVTNGDFSDNSGWKLGNGATIANGMLTLTNIGAWSEAAMQTVSVKANTSYEISWKSQYVSGSGTTNMTLMTTSFANYQIDGQAWMNSNDKNWISHSVTLNSGNNTAIVFKLTSESGGTKTINIDDVKIVEIKDPNFDGYIYNGDFESGRLTPWTNLWDKNTVDIIKGGHSGSYAMKVKAGQWSIVRQSVAVEKNTDYVVQVWSKNAVDAALLIKDGGDSTNLAQSTLNGTSNWEMTSVVFNSGNNTSVWVGFMGNEANSAYTVDDIVMLKKKAASNDGFITNGDFETATLEGFDPYQQTFVSAAAKKEGTYGVNLKGDGGWGALLEQTTKSLTKGYKYTVSFWYKANASGSNFTVKQNGTVLTAIDGENKVSAWINANEWTQVSIQFIAPATGAALINFCGGGDGNAEDIYVDSIKIVEEKACSHKYDNACDADCNLCGAKRQVADHAWKNGVCSVCGAAAPSTVTITTQPVDTYAKIGETISVSLKATGEGLTYQWWVKDVDADDYVKSSNTTNTYTTKLSELNVGRRVLCKVSDKYGNTVQSASAVLKEYYEPTITTQPVDAYAKMGETVSVSLKANGIGLTYQWWVKDAGAADYVKSSNTTNTYSAKMSETTKDRRVLCKVYDVKGNMVQSQSVLLKEYYETTIASQPVDSYAKMGEKVSVTVKANGIGLRYEWWVKDAGASSYVKSSITSNTYSVKMSATTKDRRVLCKVYDIKGNMVKSNSALLKEFVELKITSQPKTGYAKMGEKVSVSVKAQGTGLTYEWWYKNTGDSKYKKSSVTKSTYSTTLNEKSIGRRVYCRVYDMNGNLIKSESAALVEKLDLKIITQPKRATAKMGEKATVTVKAQGNGLTYTWYIKNSGSKKYSVSSVTSNKYSVTMTEKVDQRLVYCVITDVHGNTVKTETVHLVAK